MQGSGVSGLAELEPETGGQFKLKQNYPNPFTDFSVVPFNLTQASNVRIQLYNLQGQKVAEVRQNDLAKGDHEIVLKMTELGIPSATYAYMLEVENSDGVFRQAKLMTAF